MRNNYFKRKRDAEAISAGKIKVHSRRREIVFNYKGTMCRYVYESDDSHGYSTIYDHPTNACGTLIYSTSVPSLTTDLGREIYNALHEQKIIHDGGS